MTITRSFLTFIVLGLLCTSGLFAGELHPNPDTANTRSPIHFHSLLGLSLWLGGEINRDNFIFQSAYGLEVRPGVFIEPAWSAGLQLQLFAEHEIVFLTAGLYTEFMARPNQNGMYFGFSGGWVAPRLRSTAAEGYTKSTGWYMQPGMGYRIMLSGDSLEGRLGFRLHHQKTEYRYDHPFLGQVSALSDRSYLVFTVAIGSF